MIDFFEWFDQLVIVDYIVCFLIGYLLRDLFYKQ